MTIKKQYILIAIIVAFILILGLLVSVGRKKRAEIKWWRWSRKPFWTQESPTPTSSPTLTPSPLPTTPPTFTPSPQPSPSPEKPSYQASISESDFNSYLIQGVGQQPPERENPYTQATIDMQEGVAILSMHFEKGQDLTGEVLVIADGKNLDLYNVAVRGAEGFESLFIDTASDLIKEGLDNFIARIGQSIQIEKLEFKTDSLLIDYKTI